MVDMIGYSVISELDKLDIHPLEVSSSNYIGYMYILLSYRGTNEDSKKSLVYRFENSRNKGSWKHIQKQRYMLKSTLGLRTNTQL